MQKIPDLKSVKRKELAFRHLGSSRRNHCHDRREARRCDEARLLGHKPKEASGLKVGEPSFACTPSGSGGLGFRVRVWGLGFRV